MRRWPENHLCSDDVWLTKMTQLDTMQNITQDVTQVEGAR